MHTRTFAVGSLAALGELLRDTSLVGLPGDADVVVVPTAAAFTGAGEAAIGVASALEEFDVRVEALMVTDRAASDQDYFARRVAQADLVVLCDGSSLHARTTWRATALGEAIRSSANLVALGAVAGVLGEVMIDPRGGAPTNGLGYRRGVVICTPASDEQLARTRQLLSADLTLVVLGARGVLAAEDATWRLVRDEDTVVTRGTSEVVL